MAIWTSTPAGSGAAPALAWRSQEYEGVNVWKNWRQQYQVWGNRVEPIVVTPRGTTMPRGALRDAIDPFHWDTAARRYKTFRVPDWVFALKLIPRDFRGGGPFPEGRRKDMLSLRLFSLATRRYLRRRAWRYFRTLGRQHPEWYVPAMTEALVRYDDVATAWR